MKTYQAYLAAISLFATPSVWAVCPKVAPHPLMEKLLRSAGEKILNLRNAGDFETQKKKDFSDLKTKGDCTSQSTVFSGLREAYPTARLLGEEKCEQKNAASSETVSSQGPTWILDPIDGTTNYAHGMPHFSISLALVIDGEACASGVLAPVTGEFFYAARGKGAFLKISANAKPKTLRVSQIDRLNSSLFITGFEGGPSDKAKRKNEATTRVILEIIRHSHDVRRTGSAALDLASIAAGRAEGYWEYGEGLNWWDVSGGILLVTEAGGKVAVGEPQGTLAQNQVALERPIHSILATNGAPEIDRELARLVTQHLPVQAK